MDNSQSRILIITTIPEEWGGSEELWARSIPYLQDAGYEIVVFKNNINKQHQEFRKLSQRGVLLQELRLPLVIHALKKIHQKLRHKVFKKLDLNYAKTRLQYVLRKKKTRLVIISQGDNFDGLYLAKTCSEKNIPYVLIAQKAIKHLWPPHYERTNMRMLYEQAVKAYFVSRHNRELTEEQFGVRLSNAEVISNPIKIPRKIIMMPEHDKGYRLACIGRFYVLDKGQDMLIRILAMPKWKARPLTVSFIGDGHDKQSLIDMAKLWDVQNVEFLGRVEDISKLWENYHGLILPSRNEGTPLVLLEAMACSRVSIITNVGGNSDLITDGINGFLCQATENDLDEALERAWNQREQWAAIGRKAFEHIQAHIPHNPELYFAESIKKILN